MEHFHAPDGRRLAYRDTGGAGPPVLCLAGLTRNGRDFEALARHLAPRFRVIRLDARGRGASERAEDPIAEYAVPVEVREAIALIDHLGLGRAAIVGTSRGGVLGMAIASGQPGRVPALVLNDVGAAIEVRGLLRIMAEIGREPRAASFEEAAEALAAANARAFPGVDRARWLVHARAIYDDDGTGRPRLSYDPHLRGAVAASLDAGLDHVSLWPMFDSLEGVPILLLRAENSDILSAGTAERMCRTHPGMGCVEIPGRGHAPFLDEPEALSAIESFLERHMRA
jgi:pimeloyl-ACP methyl ester carboxylesterase